MKRAIFTTLLCGLPLSPVWGILPGPMADFFTHRPGETTAVVFGSRGLEPGLFKRIELLAHRNADFLKEKDPARVVEVLADTAFRPEHYSRRSLVLMGSTKSNRILAEWKESLPFMIREGRFNIAGRKHYSGGDVTFSCIFPNPLANDRYLLLLVGNEAWAQPSLSDWSGDYDYYVALRHALPGRYLNRGRFEKTSSLWAHTLTDYEQSPGEPQALIGLSYPHGTIRYPFSWERDSLWKDPGRERIRLLANVARLVSFYDKDLKFPVRGGVDFHLSEEYAQALAADPLGNVFVQTSPGQMDSLAFYEWGAPAVRALIPCVDAALDWELFCHRHLWAETFFQMRQLRMLGKPIPFAQRGREWLEALTAGDSTYLALFRILDQRGLKSIIFEALDSVLNKGKKHSFRMREFLDILARVVPDTALGKSVLSFRRASPYHRPPAFDLGIKNPDGLFLKREVVLGDLVYAGRAFAAGLRKGDKVVALDGFPVSENRSRAYLAWLAKRKGDNLKFEIVRKGARRTVLVPVG